MRPTSAARPVPRPVSLALCSALVVALTTWVAPPVGAAPTAPTAAPCAEPTDRPWCDTALSSDERAALLLEELTLDEKISLLGGDDLGGVTGGEGTHTGTSRGIERLRIPTLYFSDGPVGTRQGKATQMPSPISVASSFSADVARTAGGIIADEARKKGNHVVFAPGVNIGRTPLNGRTFEYYGEDPYLAGRMAVGFIRGVHDAGAIANVKHFAVNNQEGEGIAVPGSPIGLALEGNRLFVDAQVDERTLREIYLPAFEAAVKAGQVGTVMCSYNRINGEFGCQNRHLLTDILKGEWGFRGFVLSDYLAAKSPAKSLRNGLDLDIWPGIVYTPALVRTAMLVGGIHEATIDEHVRRILRTMFEFRVFDEAPLVDDASRIDAVAHHEEAARVEADGMVLLRNQGALLPLDESSLRTVAVIGPEADVLKTGGGSSDVNPLSRTTPLQGLRARLGDARVVHDDGKDAARAARVAAAADVAVVVVGDSMTEGADKVAPTLDAGQRDGIGRDALVAAVAKAQPRTVVALQSGGPVTLPWRDQVPAILEMWYPGQNGGTALTRVLLGDAEPGGRLPMTFPASANDLPTAGDRARYPGILGTVKYLEGVLVGYRHFDAKDIAPAYPFGHGLGYGTVRIGAPTVTAGGSGGDVATVSVTVENTGDRATVAVPQLYVGMPQPDAATTQPPRQLKGFDKVRLAPGESRTVRFGVDERALSYWSTPAKGWRIADGCYAFSVGASSRDLAGTARAGWNAACAGGVRLR